MASSNPISLRVSNKRAYLWNVDDIATLRAHHHICGLLTGTLPHLSQQNVFLGLPLLLMPEEAVLLVDAGLAILVDDQNAHHHPGAAALARWDQERIRGVEEQRALAEEHEAREASHPDRAMSERALLKRKEREASRARRAPPGALEPSQRAAATHPPGSELGLGPPPSLPTTCARRSNPTAPYTVHVPGASSAFEWYAPSLSAFTTLAAARDAGVWDYPETPLQRARCGVFRDLWKQGYFMGSGIKFGGEYLVYPGDPLRYHSHFVASVIESPAAPLRPMDIIAHGRLGTGTKKSHLLCEWDGDSEGVTYYSIEWAGFG